MQQLQSQGLCLGKWNGNTDYSGGGHVETCKYKIAQFKTQTKDGVGGAGHVGSGATCKEQAAECPCVLGWKWCPVRHLHFTFLVFSSVESLFYCQDTSGDSAFATSVH